MGKMGFFFFGELDEIKVKQLQVIFDIEDYEKAKELYIKTKTDFESK